MPKKPEVVRKDPRLLNKGAVIWHSGNQREEVVRAVSVVLHLANGESQTYSVGTDEVELLKVQPDPVKQAELLIAKETPDEAKERIQSKRRGKKENG
jgi:hypothetical protein